MAKGRFSGARQKHAAQVLATAGPRSLFELLDAVGGEKRALERSLESLATQGLVDAVDTGNAPAPGQPSRLWSLTTRGRAALPAVSTDEVGRLAEGRLWIQAAFSSDQAVQVHNALADGDLVAGIDWVARLDGDGRSYFFVFDPAMGPQPVENLFRVLSEIGARCSMGSARAPQGALDFVDTIRTSARAAARATQSGEAR
jgi:DNA-binding HxlR family transcriptional regulator